MKKGCVNGGVAFVLAMTMLDHPCDAAVPVLPKSLWDGKKTVPKSAKDTAGEMNWMWQNFDENNPDSYPGLLMSMAGQPQSFFMNIYCHDYYNPARKGYTGCANGALGDCRLSTFLTNRRFPVNYWGKLMPAMGRTVGYVFNTDMVRQVYGKCMFIWDGATFNSYNAGCGTSAWDHDCNSKWSAYGGYCHSTGKICTADDPEVKNAFCQGYGGGMQIPPHHDGFAQCVIPGTSIDYHGQDFSDYKPRDDNLFNMAKERVLRNRGTVNGRWGAAPNSEQWTEVVLDLRLFLAHMKEDPAGAIKAFVYAKGNWQALNMAKNMRDEYQRLLNYTGTKIPVVAMDHDSTPFSPGDGEDNPAEDSMFFA